MSVLNNSNAIETGGYNIQRSLRFRSSASAYLSRTPASAGNRKTWTWSGWAKRGTLGASNRIFAADDGSASTDQDYNTLFFTSADKIQFSGGLTNFRITTSVYRDPSAWYHIVFVTDTTQATAGNRFKLYVNGVEVTAFDTSNNPAQNTDLAVNAAIGHYHAAIASPVVNYFDGYLAEVNFIDGQALTPSSFGQTDPVTGVWTPKKYTGTYGTNGFYLPFSDNTSATTLAYDKSGNGNNWTPNNISTTAGATYDSMTDVPTLTSATAANYCVLNPISKPANVTMSNGNLTSALSTTSGHRSCGATIYFSSGKYYWEAVATTLGSSSAAIGIANNSFTIGNEAGSNCYYYYPDGTKVLNGTSTSYGATWTANDNIGVAFDADNGYLTFYKNGVSQGQITGIPTGVTYFALLASNTSVTASVFDINFGQRPFSYTPPTGFKALNTFNLPDPTIKKPNQYMDANTWSGTSAAQNITSLNFAPDMTWIKSRSNASNNYITDAVRGLNYGLQTNITNAEVTNTNVITAFNSNGFSLGDDATANVANISGRTYVGWSWKKGATPGFDIVTYTGTGGTGTTTVGHGLGVAPKLVIVKKRSAAADWAVYHTSLTSTSYYLVLDTTAAQTSYGSTFISPGSSTLTIAADSSLLNTSTATYVAYCWAEIPGFSKFGSYPGNGSANGPFVYCGFRPKYVMVKRTDVTAYDWVIIDTSRSPYNLAVNQLYANSTSIDATGTDFNADFVSNGFKVRTTGLNSNANGGTYIYMAFAESPFKTSLAR